MCLIPTALKIGIRSRKYTHINKVFYSFVPLDLQNVPILYV